MQEAALVNFLRTILILLLIYYGFKLIARFILPLLMKKFVNNVEKKFQERQGQYQSNKQQSKVGETVVDKAPRPNKTTNDKVGEYVDYEEVD